MAEGRAEAVAHPNIAFIKYWGNQDHQLRLPANSSLSMTLGGLTSTTSVEFDPKLRHDQFTFNNEPASTAATQRVAAHLDRIRALAGQTSYAYVESENNFPSAAGIASSASGFAALTLAAAAASGLDLSPKELSSLARRGSGSASRSIFGGFVEWRAAQSDEDSFAQPIADQDHWKLIDLVTVVEEGEKPVGSSEGHQLADSSPLQHARVESASSRLEAVRAAILAKDFPTLARLAELDSDMMHAVMMTSTPPLLYWQPATVEVMQKVRRLREQGIPVFYTLDAGPNPHCLCPVDQAETVEQNLRQTPGVIRIIKATPGGPARLVNAG